MSKLILRCLVVAGLALLPAAGHALPIDAATAAARAAAQLRSQPTALRSGGEAVVVSRTPATYLFATADAFVLAAADDELPAVLGYGTLGGGALPPALGDLRAAYDRLQRLTPHIAKHQAEATTPVAPLLRTWRSQDDPYNRLCPTYRRDDGTMAPKRCKVGCVATALEQILTYYRRTYTLRDTLHGWTTAHYALADELPAQSVDTRLIAAHYDTAATDAETDAVARLSYWLGLAVHMNWGLDASGASSARAVEPLRRVFGLPYAQHVKRYHYSPATWRDILLSELQARRPIYYAASTERVGGHAFVIDGTDSEGRYHVNWGYGGYYDGYFDLEVLNFAEPPYDTTPEGYQNGFFCNQEALLLSPDTVSTALPDTLRRTGQEIVATAWRLLAYPMMTAYTPLELTLKNTSAETLTTTLEVFTNLETDTAVFAQADYAALTGVTLAGGEERSLVVDLRFDADGQRYLRLSADDAHYQTLGLINISPYYLDDLTYDPLQLSFPADSTLRLVERISNTPTAARAGRYVTYELLPQPCPDDAQGTRHGHYFYLLGGEALTDTATFRGLTPGATYRLLVRCPWVVRHDTTFTLPAHADPSAITAPPTAPTATAPTWRTLDGRRIKAPTAPGLYLRGREKVRYKP